MIFLAKAALGLGATMAVAGAYVFHEGVIRVDFDEKRAGGSHVHFWVPATAVSASLRLAPRHCLEDAATKAGRFLPLLREISKELEKYPNGEFVEMQGLSGRVRVAMVNGKLEIDAVGDDQVVHVRVPAETVRSVADRLEGAAPGI
jgi:hypothetical protein